MENAPSVAPVERLVGRSLNSVNFDFIYPDPLGEKSGDRIIQCTMAIRFTKEKQWNAVATTTNSMTRIGEQFRRFNVGFPNSKNAARIADEVANEISDRWQKWR